MPTFTVPAPTFVDNVQQSFFIEPLGGTNQPRNYLDRFPEQIYNKSPDSNLVALLYSLMGPAGFGWLQQNYLQARLEIEDSGLSTVDLDNLYANPFGFGRLAQETYTVNTNGLLTAAQQTQVAKSDAAYRNRALDFLGAARAGGTLLGITLAAQSGIGRPVEVYENYRALYDQYADDPLGILYRGSTLSTEEIIIVPRNDRPISALQTLTVQSISLSNPLLPPTNPSALPTTGTFTLTLPLGSAFQSTIGNTLSSLTGSITANTNTLTLSAPSSLVQPGMQIVVAGAGFGTTLITTVTNVDSTNTILTLASPAVTTVTGAALILTDPITTVPLPYNVSSDQAQQALENLAIIGHGNVSVTGGPFPSIPLKVAFTRALADTSVPALIVNSNVGNGVDSFVINVVTNQVGVSADGETATISPQNLHSMYSAVNRIKPMTTIVTTGSGPGDTVRQVSQSIYSDSEFSQALRFVTGQTVVPWPPLDSSHWIEPSIEHEAPRAVGDIQHHYQNFHNIASITSYTEAALLDAAYGKQTGILANYNDEHLGPYTPYQRTIFPLLAQTDGSQAFATEGQALPANPAIIEMVTNDSVSLIQGIYPLDYRNLPNITPPLSGNFYWGSLERATGQDYLEIDLGRVQVVNYLSFEVTQKPYNIAVSYDVLDLAPARTFKPVTLVSNMIVQSKTSTGHDVTQNNPWDHAEIYFTNSLGAPIYTRFIRIAFTKRVGESSFTLPTGINLPFSVEVQNLRVGRNVAFGISNSVSLPLSTLITSGSSSSSPPAAGIIAEDLIAPLPSSSPPAAGIIAEDLIAPLPI